MIHQFAELGQFYIEREGVNDQLTQFAADPSAKFRSKEVLLLVFSQGGFQRVEVHEYDEGRRLRCLYRPGPPNGWDATPTTGMATVKKGKESTADPEIAKKLTRLARSIEDATRNTGVLPDWEPDALSVMHEHLEPPSRDNRGDDPRSNILAALREAHPDLSKTAILSVAWRTDKHDLRWAGDFVAFRQSLIRKGMEAASKSKGIAGDVKGIGQCCICGKRDVEVSGLLKVEQFKIYTIDKPGSVSGGFNPLMAWRNFPACRECCDNVDFSGERIKKELSFNYYGFKYLVLPSPVRLAKTEAYDSLARLVSARLSHKAAKRLTEAEDELFEIISHENNLLQLDLLFYRADPQSFRPSLYVSGLLPSRFRRLFEAKDRVDGHAWVIDPSPKSFSNGRFTFGSLRQVFPAAHGGSTFDDDFLAATRAALELRRFPKRRLLEIGMRWVQDDYVSGKAWQFRIAHLFRSLLFFEELATPDNERSEATMRVDYGLGDQGKRVTDFFKQAPSGSRLQADASAQAAFLVGACCGRIETIQGRERQSTPFDGKYKGFRLNEPDVRRLFVAAKDKAKAYGPENEKIVSGLLSCAAAALAAAPDKWELGADEVAYYFSLGHALRTRLAREKGDEANSGSSNEE